MDYNTVSNQAVLADLGRKIETIRLQQNLRREDLAAVSGVSKGTVKNIEGGNSVGSLYLVAVLRGLGEVGSLSRLLQVPPYRPVDLKAGGGKRRRRASGHRISESPPAGEWKWGDET
ncbi:helix-turn-helix transcriptional regulator [Exilibacterium tricleocarpae]|uniref:Helix-turn-helix transcriptional regulator n=1 Tax=Exilibacterium tricleocarpae TaxID=2591008 RepID=A0A545U9E7_9GAMM|nr:helix-turn-helix transcriptional regulator [Exilibacterium tricleocarpae]TQV86091.1 helix-turn-helix transcriptional regulator [Exilibacterium tricleocarpae]